MDRTSREFHNVHNRPPTGFSEVIQALYEIGLASNKELLRGKLDLSVLSLFQILYKRSKSTQIRKGKL
jgi:hypothetical protein